MRKAQEGSLPKSASLERALSELSKEFFGRERTGKECVACGSTAVQDECFRDALSIKEFSISHLCQSCQDETFK